MATAQDYADWIVKNADKKGTPEFDTVAKAYSAARSTAAPVASAAPPAKPFGQQLNDSIADIPRQVGLTARYGLEGAGQVFDSLVGNPLRTLAAPVLGNKPTGDTGKGLADLARLPQPATSRERVVGDATRMAAGALIPIGAGAVLARGGAGLAQGVGRVVASNPATQIVSAAASGAASGATRESGGNDTSQTVAGLAAGLAAPYAIGRTTALAGNVAGRLRSGNAQQSQQELDVTIKHALDNGGTNGGVSFSNLSEAVQNGIRKDVADALKVSGSVTPEAVRRLADYRLTGALPTAGTLTLDPATVTQQKNLAKLGINSKDAAAQTLGRTENANNQTLINGLNYLGAATAGTPVAGGRTIMNALAQRDTTARRLIGDRYAAARASDGRSAAIDPYAFTNQANNALDESLLGGKLPSDVRNLLNNAATGRLPLTVDTAEQFKTRIGDLQRASSDAAERKALGLVRSALDNAPLLDNQGQGAIDAFNKARGLNRAYMQIVEKTPALEAVRDGIEPDKFVQQFIVGNGAKSNIADVNALYGSIKKSPEAVQAVKEQIVSHLKTKALNGASDETGKISQSAYNKALSAIGDEKLARFFPQAEIDQLKAIGRVASYEQFQPAGAAVNNSNTAAAGLAAIFDRIANSTLLSKIPLGNALAVPAQNISVGIRSRQSLNVPQAIAGNRLVPTNRFLPSPLIGQTRDDEEQNALAKPR
jgi:hypothetical protein